MDTSVRVDRGINSHFFHWVTWSAWCFLVLQIGFGFGNRVLAESKTSTSPAAKSARGGSSEEKSDKGEKVDISDLETKYWAPKDTEFSVVQNRLYTKANRFGVTLLGGYLINDSYSDANQIGGAVNYYFSERVGAEFQYQVTNSKDNQAVQDFRNQLSSVPNHNKAKKFYGANFNWIPIYAKISLLEKKILYFDMSFSPGIGMTEYKNERSNGAGDVKNAFTLSLDIAQHVYLSKNFALRLDMKNRFYNQSVVNYNFGNELNSINSHAISILLGFTYLP